MNYKLLSIFFYAFIYISALAIYFITVKPTITDIKYNFILILAFIVIPSTQFILEAIGLSTTLFVVILEIVILFILYLLSKEKHKK